MGVSLPANVFWCVFSISKQHSSASLLTMLTMIADRTVVAPGGESSRLVVVSRPRGVWFLSFARARSHALETLRRSERAIRHSLHVFFWRVHDFAICLPQGDERVVREIAPVTCDEHCFWCVVALHDTV